MATRMMTKGFTRADLLVSWALVAGMAPALAQVAQETALPSHFV